MTVEEFEKNYRSKAFNWNFSDALREYAKLKCQELLLLIAEKADKAHVGEWELDRDDVLNIIDLDSFCS